MRSLLIVPLFCILVCALPQDASCATTTTTAIVPTATHTFTSTYVTTEYATTPKDLGTFTQITVIRSTQTLTSLTSTSTDCTASSTLTVDPAVTVYTNATVAGQVTSNTNNVGELQRRQAGGCTVTETFTTTYGVTQTYLPASQTSTYTAHSAFTQHTVSSTTHRGTSYTIATVTATTSAVCGPTVTAAPPTKTSTVTQDARCAPSALVSAAGGSNGSPGYGLLYMSNVPLGGATYVTSTDDASECCQLCIEEDGCAASAWDIRSNECRLQFSVNPSNGELNCGQGALVYYNYGPNHPMLPGTGWYMGVACGNVYYTGAKPDDGT